MSHPCCPPVTESPPDDMTSDEYEAWVIDQQSPDYHG
jgi:hypothetical protein